jgi:hypothetical protein
MMKMKNCIKLLTRENEQAEIKKELWRLSTEATSLEYLKLTRTLDPIVGALNYHKGLVIMQRVLELLDPVQNIGFFSVLFKRLESLQVCNIILGKETEKVEEFMNSIFPTLTNLFAESNFKTITGLMRIILERHNLIWLATSRVGLVIMTMILSHAEMLKHSTSPLNTTQDLDLWSEIYNFIFISFQDQFAQVFKNLVEPEDEVYIWQFLAAMAVGASGIDHQRILVTELRENVIQTSKDEHPRALENVNLFLTALGLNITATQLAAMS